MTSHKIDKDNIQKDEEALSNSYLKFIQSFFQTEDPDFNDIASKFYIEISENNLSSPAFALLAFRDISLSLATGIEDPLKTEEFLNPTFEVRACSKFEEVLIIKYVVKFLNKKSKHSNISTCSKLKVTVNFLKHELKARLTSQIYTESIQTNNLTKKINPHERLQHIRSIVEKRIEGIDVNKKWEYSFSSESDFRMFTTLLTSYFMGLPYKLPELIQLKRSCKTRFAQAMNSLHKDLGNRPLASDLEFLRLFNVLNHFEKWSEDQVYTAITR